MLALTEVTAPPVEPIGLEEAKDHLRVDHTDEDALIDALILTARQRVETHTGRALITQTWDWSLDRFSQSREPLRAPKPPLQSITSIQYYDNNDVQQTLATTVYQVDAVNQPARITLADGQQWPNTFNRLNAVTIRFVAGYGATGNFVPWPIKAAMLLIIGHFYCHRDEVSTRTPYKLPFGVDALLHPYVNWKF